MEHQCLKDCYLDGVNFGRDGLLSAAVATLAANPAASLQDIADSAGISRATLHRRFASREALVAAIADWALGEVQAFTHAIASDGATGRDALDRLLEHGVQLAPKLGFLSMEVSLDADVTLMTRMDAIASVWHGWVEDGQRRGEIRVDLPARWIGDAVEGLMMAVFRGVRIGTTAPADALRLVRITLFDGIIERRDNPPPDLASAAEHVAFPTTTRSS